MASSGAARSCLLQACQRGSLTTSSSTRALPLAPLLAQHVQQQQSRLASSSSSSSSKKGSPTTSLVVPRSPQSVAVLGAKGADPKTTKRKGPPVNRHKNSDHSKLRGLSAMRRTGSRESLSVSGLPLPRPVEEAKFPRIKTDPDHGLWQFFYERGRALNSPKQDREHGRAWRVEELRRKSWKDLHSLWWVCIKERNRIMTGNWERKKGRYGYGDVESKEREVEVRKTQNAIKHVLTERFYAWEDALELAKNDPEIVIDGNSARYKRGGKPGWENEPEVVEDSVWADDELLAVEAKADQPSLEAPPSDQSKGQQEAPRL